jgi:hypothetical protein
MRFLFGKDIGPSSQEFAGGKPSNANAYWLMN